MLFPTMENTSTSRLTYEQSCKSLQEQQWLKPGDIPPLPTRPPAYDDEILGVEFFRTSLDGKLGADFENLSLPRTFFGRSDIVDITFRNTDFSESVANWNDFIDVNFLGADLSRCDFRACKLTRVSFENSTLADADLRCCNFESCTFTGADMTGTKMTRTTGIGLQLSKEQRAVVDWHEEDGEAPGGG